MKNIVDSRTVCSVGHNIPNQINSNTMQSLLSPESMPTSMRPPGWNGPELPITRSLPLNKALLFYAISMPDFLGGWA